MALAGGSCQLGTMALDMLETGKFFPGFIFALYLAQAENENCFCEQSYSRVPIALGSGSWDEASERLTSAKSLLFQL